MKEIENIFIDMLKDCVIDIRSSRLPKGKFIGKYMEKIEESDSENFFRYKRSQVIGDGKEPNNNWIDYIIRIDEEEFNYFK